MGGRCSACKKNPGEEKSTEAKYPSSSSLTTPKQATGFLLPLPFVKIKKSCPGPLSLGLGHVLVTEWEGRGERSLIFLSTLNVWAVPGPRGER